MIRRTDTLQVRTPEGVTFSFRLAGPISRFLAWLIDACVVVMILMFCGWMLMFMLGVLGDFASMTMLLLMLVVPILYGMLLEWFMRGQTIGKRALRLRVIDEQGLRLQFSQVVVRNLLRPVDSMPIYLIGGLACLLSARAQRLGDVAASTLVIQIVQPDEPDLEAILGGKYNSLRDYPHLEARLRQRTSPREAGLALQSVLRRDSLRPDARVDLFASLAGHFKSLVEFPQEATDGITDEQYIRNVVDVLYRSRK